jgi:hypothetical protein
MNTVRAALISLALLALFAFPAAAQGVVSVNFELTMNGEPPEGSAFYVVYGPPLSEITGFARLVDPDGDGVYTATSVEVPTNMDGETAYAFSRTHGEAELDEAVAGIFWPKPEAGETRGFEEAAVDEGDTLRATVSFEGEIPADIGDAGAGGMAAGGGGLPIGPVAALISLLTAGGYTALRHRG